MPKIATRRTRIPAGFEVIEPTLKEFEKKMRLAEADDIADRRADELLWPIVRLHHQRSRFVYQQYYEKKEITKEVYEYCLDQKYADANLIAKWKKDGFKDLCCLRCIQTTATNNFKTCICRVPKKDLDKDNVFECKACGCRGCV